MLSIALPLSFPLAEIISLSPIPAAKVNNPNMLFALTLFDPLIISIFVSGNSADFFSIKFATRA